MGYDTMHLKIMPWIFPDERNVSSFRHTAPALCGFFSVTEFPCLSHLTKSFCEAAPGNKQWEIQTHISSRIGCHRQKRR